jgi:hypothetical protein
MSLNVAQCGLEVRCGHVAFSTLHPMERVGTLFYKRLKIINQIVCEKLVSC